MMEQQGPGAQVNSVGKGTPFTPRTTPLCKPGLFAQWNEYLMPETFTGFDEEVRAIRESVMLEDKSPLDKYFFSGPGAQEYLQHLTTRDLSRIEINHAYYAPFCDERGRVIVEGLVFRIEEDKYCLTSDPMDKWFAQHTAGFDVEVENVSDDFGILHVQGPDAHDVVTRITGRDWQDLRFSRGTETQIGGVDVRLWRTGFTGERGYEFWVPAESAIEVWDTIVAAGEPFGLTMCGLNAQNVARIEAGLLIAVLDYTRAGPDALQQDSEPYGAQSATFEATPGEIGLGYLVDFEKDDFVGKEALLDVARQGGARRTQVGLRIDWADIVDLQTEAGVPPEIARRVHQFPLRPVRSKGREVGIVSSITWSPIVGQIIGLGRLEKELAVQGTPVTIDWEVQGKSYQVGATVTDLPFVEIKRKK